MSKLQSKVDVLILTFSVGENITTDIMGLSKAVNALGISTKAIVVSEEDSIKIPEGSSIAIVQKGTTKLEKIKSQLSEQMLFFCVIDSDMHLNIDVCAEIIQTTINGKFGIGFGIVESVGGKRILDSCIHLDKRWSHYVLRPMLHKFGIGITVPGQFIIYSPELLSAINENIDTFLDDLYFGLKCRLLGMRFFRLGKVVGYEEGRQDWSSLLIQRIRWMKGLFRLSKNTLYMSGAWRYCASHYMAYHGVPVIYALAITWLLFCNQWLLASVFLTVSSILLAITYGSLHPVILVYSLSFPLIHILATIAAFFPISIMRLRRR